MLLFGLLLVVVTGAFTGLLIADNLSGGPEYQVTVLGNDLVTLNSLGVFLAGLALALLFCLGLALMRASRRARPLRRTARHDRRTATGTPASRTDERIADERLIAERPSGDRPVDERTTAGRTTAGRTTAERRPAAPVAGGTVGDEAAPSAPVAAGQGGRAAGSGGRLRHLLGR
ncbi:hypothetical protein ACFVFS_08820 [Kitasatospora sp. NPDC057692]|uniref:hypothetical protein n=1 Tax=Kitasatospora sp. NPDC057692 TaxID=3346215 RepID=UPI00369D68DA